MNAIEMYLDAMLDLRRRSGFVAKNSRFGCLDDFFRQQGKAFKSAALTKDEAAYVRRVLRGFRPTKKGCFYNAQMLVLRDGECRLTYCEGYGLSGGLPIPIHHAWVVINDKVIDVTWDKGKVRGKFSGCYFGAPVAREEVLENLRHGAEAGEVLPVVDNWRRGWPLVTGKAA